MTTALACQHQRVPVHKRTLALRLRPGLLTDQENLEERDFWFHFSLNVSVKFQVSLFFIRDTNANATVLNCRSIYEVTA